MRLSPNDLVHWRSGGAFCSSYDDLASGTNASIIGARDFDPHWPISP
jgi:hypothetical protein